LLSERDDAEANRQRDDDDDDYFEGANEREQEDLNENSDDEGDLPAVGERHLNLEAFDCPLRDWISEDRTRKEIQRRFKTFLLSFYSGIEDVARWKAKHAYDGKALPPMPGNLKVLPPVYNPKIR
jgi:hypothetical protein